MTDTRAPYVELHCHSGYSFLDGASHPEELALRAAELGYESLALTVHEGVYGSLEFAQAAKHFGVRPLTGAEVTLRGGTHVTLLVASPAGYANLCRLLTAAHADTRGTQSQGREAAPLGVLARAGSASADSALAQKMREPVPPALDQALLEEVSDGLVCLSGCARDGLGVRDPNAAARLAQAFGDRFYVELQRPFERGDVHRNGLLRDLAAHLGAQTVVTGNVHAHDPRRTSLQDVLVAIRHRTTLDGSHARPHGRAGEPSSSPGSGRRWVVAAAGGAAGP